MWTTIECAGHPRDMGLAQGFAARTAIRTQVDAAGLPMRRSRMPSLRPLSVGAVRGSGAGRELSRHFAHQEERLEGLARSADLPLDSLVELFLRVRAGGEEGGLLSRRASLRAHTLGGDGAEKRTVLERTLPRAMSGEAGWILRESRPAVGFRSVEVALPWLVPGLAGVNEAGLAVMAGPILWGEQGRSGFPPSALLVQECLQRFEDLAGALDWCCKRPVEGEQSFVLADAAGTVATVISSGRACRVQEGEGELYLEGGELPGEDAEASVAKSDGTASEPDRVVLDPARRLLRVEAEGALIEIDLP